MLLPESESSQNSCQGCPWEDACFDECRLMDYPNNAQLDGIIADYFRMTSPDLRWRLLSEYTFPLSEAEGRQFIGGAYLRELAGKQRVGRTVTTLEFLSDLLFLPHTQDELERIQDGFDRMKDVIGRTLRRIF